MLKDLDFAENYIIFVIAKRRMPNDKGFSPLFLCENGRKNHCFTKHIEKFICRSGFSKCFCGFFSGLVGARIDDIGNRKVKIHLFSTLHFLHFRVTTQVVYCRLGALFGAPRGSNQLVAQGSAKRRPGCCRPSPAFILQGQKRKKQRLLFVHSLHLL